VEGRGHRAVRADGWTKSAAVKYSENTAKAAKENRMPEKGKPRGRSYQPGESGNPGGRPLGARNKDKGMLADLMKEYLEESQVIEVGKGKNKHSTLLTRKELFIRAVFNETIKGNVAAQRLVFNYVDGLPTLNIALEGRLVNLGYDLELSAEDEEWYGELLSQFFIEPEALRKPKTREGGANARRKKGKD